MVQHDGIKYVEVDLESGLICILFVLLQRKLVDVLTKGLASTIFQAMISKLRIDNIYSPIWGGVLKIWIFLTEFFFFFCIYIYMCV